MRAYYINIFNIIIIYLHDIFDRTVCVDITIMFPDFMQMNQKLKTPESSLIQFHWTDNWDSQIIYIQIRRRYISPPFKTLFIWTAINFPLLIFYWRFNFIAHSDNLTNLFKYY